MVKPDSARVSQAHSSSRGRGRGRGRGGSKPRQPFNKPLPSVRSELLGVARPQGRGRGARGRGGRGAGQQHGRRALTPDQDLFQRLAREVAEFGATGLSGKERKAFDERKVVALGGSATKQARAPFKIYLGMQAKQRERARKQRELDRLTGNVVKIKAARRPRK